MMKETTITTGQALRMAMGMSTLELVVSLALLVIVAYLLYQFTKELQAIVRAMDDDTYDRYLAATGRKRGRRTKSKRSSEQSRNNAPSATWTYYEKRSK